MRTLNHVLDQQISPERTEASAVQVGQRCMLFLFFQKFFGAWKVLRPLLLRSPRLRVAGREQA